MKIAVLLSSIAERTYPQLWPTMVDDFIQIWIHSTLPRYYTVMMMMIVMMMILMMMMSMMMSMMMMMMMMMMVVLYYDDVMPRE